MVRFAPLASSAPDGAEQLDQLTVWFAAQLWTQVGVPVCPTIPFVQVKDFAPVVGAVESVDVALPPLAIANADGAVHVLPDTVHVVPAATVQLSTHEDVVSVAVPPLHE